MQSCEKQGFGSLSKLSNKTHISILIFSTIIYGSIFIPNKAQFASSVSTNSTAYGISNHTYSTIQCWLNAVRATVCCLSECCTWTQNLCGATGIIRIPESTGSSLLVGSEMALHKVHHYLLLLCSYM